MAARSSKSSTNQGVRLGGGFKGTVKGNPMKPKLKANIKLSQGNGGGIKQSRGGAKYVTSARPGTGLKQSGTTAKKPMATKVRPNKLSKKPISAQPKYAKNNPKQPKNNFTLHNKVQKGDVSRLQKAGNFALPPMNGGSFKNFIKGN